MTAERRCAALDLRTLGGGGGGGGVRSHLQVCLIIRSTLLCQVDKKQMQPRFDPLNILFVNVFISSMHG